MKLIEIIDRKSIDLNLSVKSKDELLIKLNDLAAESGKVSNKNETLKQIYERERIMSTGVGKGVALPHAKTNSVETAVASAVVLKEPVDFESLDGKPVEIAFLLLGREDNVGAHLRLLGKLSRLLNNREIYDKLLKCKTPEEFIEIFNQADCDN